MEEKIVRQKLNKSDPGAFLYNETFFPYLQMLEEKRQLSSLPKNLYVYYVLSVFFGEVNNGGFSQFMTNSSRDLLYELEPCAAELGERELCTLVSEFVKTVGTFMEKHGQTAETFDADDDLERAFHEFDERFYRLFSKIDYDCLLLRYYKDRYSVKYIDFTAVKEKENAVCRYFRYEPENDLLGAARAFCSFLSEFPVSWKVEVSEIGVIAHPSKNCFDLKEIFTYFDDKTHPFGRFRGKVQDTDRKKILAFGSVKINGILPPDECRPGMIESNVIRIRPSGFDDNEYQIKQTYGIGLFQESPLSRRLFSSVTVGEFETYGITAASKEEMLRCLLMTVRKYRKIRSVYETRSRATETGLSVKKTTRYVRGFAFFNPYNSI